jgi:hypothetical protein
VERESLASGRGVEATAELDESVHVIDHKMEDGLHLLLCFHPPGSPSRRQSHE